MNTNFQTAYLKSLNLIKQEEEDKKEKCEKCGKEPCECDDKKDVKNECGDATNDSPSNDGEVLTEGDDEEDVDLDDTDSEEETEGQDEAPADDAEDTEQGQEQGDSEEATCFCFKTINKDLIDIINSGFDKVVFTVKAVDDDGKETTTDVEISADAFEDFGECEEDAGDGDGEDDLAGDDDLGLDEEFGDVEQGGQEDVSLDGEEDTGDEDTSFESVFKRYYGALVGEEKK